MSKIEGWSRNRRAEGREHHNISGFLDDQPVVMAWNNDKFNYPSVENSLYVYSTPDGYRVAYTNHQGERPVDRHTIIETEIDSREDARKVATSWAENHPYGKLVKGSKVPMMTDYGDVTYVEIVDPEPEKDTVVIRTLEDDPRIGAEEGEQTAVDEAQIMDALNLDPVDRDGLHTEFERDVERY